jgi:hypothetical protein
MLLETKKGEKKQKTRINGVKECNLFFLDTLRR